MDEDAPSGTAGDDAHRRRLQQIAYGRDADADTRAKALAELDSLERADRAAIRASALRRASAVPEQSLQTRASTDPWDEPLELASTADDDADDTRRPFGRRRRIVIAVVAVVTAIALAVTAVGVGSIVFAGPEDSYERSQVAADRDAPEWLTNAFLIAENRTGTPGLADRLADSVRRVEGGDGLVGYLFRDEATETYCLAGSRGFDCAGPSTYELNGLLVTMIDPRDPAESALRYEMRSDTGFRARVLELDRPASVQQMDPARWPSMISQCLQTRGFAVAADPSGQLFPAPIDDDAQLEQAMAIVHCSWRFPMMGEYLTVLP